jgi:hypothetical protein
MQQAVHHDQIKFVRILQEIVCIGLNPSDATMRQSFLTVGERNGRTVNRYDVSSGIRESMGVFPLAAP